MLQLRAVDIDLHGHVDDPVAFLPDGFDVAIPIEASVRWP